MQSSGIDVSGPQKTGIDVPSGPLTALRAFAGSHFGSPSGPICSCAGIAIGLQRLLLADGTWRRSRIAASAASFFCPSVAGSRSREDALAWGAGGRIDVLAERRSGNAPPLWDAGTRKIVFDE